MRKHDRSDVNIIRVMHGAECWTDHRLVRSKFKFVVKPKFRGRRTALPKRLNIVASKDGATREQLEQKLEATDCENTWESLKKSIFSVSADILGFRQRSHKDWVDENDDQIQTLFDKKRNIFEHIFNR